MSKEKEAYFKPEMGGQREHSRDGETTGESFK